MAFVKLDCGILDSTLWVDRDSREVFITALLMALPYEQKEPTPQLQVRSLEPTGWIVPPGWYGFVHAAGPGIVRRSGVEMESGLNALERLGSPDAESRSPEFDGRRLVRIDGGYLVMNLVKYRDKDNTTSERSKRYRERMKNREASRRDIVTTVTERHTASHNVTSQSQSQSQRSESDKNTNASASLNSPDQTPKAGKPAKERVRNEFFDILAGAGDQNPEAMTESEGGRVAKALSDIRKACPDLTTDELKRRIQNYRLHFPEAILTPTAISSNWSRLESAPAPKSPAPRDTNPSRKNENLQSKVLSVNP